jgi:hypothetical protein
MLGGSTITTEITDGKMGKEVGKFIFPEGKIYLANEYNGYVCSRDYMETSFFHELTHGILDYMGKHELSNDEEFVEGFANMLHQYMKTKK